MIRFANAVESAGLVISWAKLVRRACQTEHGFPECYESVTSDLRSKTNHGCEVRQNTEISKILEKCLTQHSSCRQQLNAPQRIQKLHSAKTGNRNLNSTTALVL